MKIDKFEMYYNLMERWMTVHEEGRTIADILAARNFHTIALYGLGKIGKHVVFELADSDITVSYGIDRAKPGIYNHIPVKKVEDDYPAVDAILVSAVYDFDEIEPVLKEKTDCPVVSLEEILYEG